MKKLYTIFTTHKYAIIWTICYIFLMWATLYFLFNFSIFNGAQWHKLARAELHGFAGFVFGLLILSALPMYIATITLIIRNKKPLITIPTPKVTLPKLIKKTETISDEAQTKSENEINDKTETEKLPDELPLELHSIFIRSRNRIPAYEQCSPLSHGTSDEQNTEQPSNTFPLPTDFDVQLDEIPGMNDMPSFKTPIFTDITFGDEPIGENESENTTEPYYPNNKKMIEHLSKTNTPFNIADNIIVTGTHAIISHCDSDFWVIDEKNWFANGKTRPSPINTVQQFATEHNLTPVIYLESTNIMDLDIHIKNWESNGIIVINSPEEL